MKRYVRFWIAFKSILAVVICLAWWLSPSQTVVVTENQIDSGDRPRHYRLVAPDPAPTAPTPIVFAFYGTGDTTSSMAEYSQLDDLAVRHGFILVYPAAGDAGWTIDAEGANDLSELSDIQFVDHLLTALSTRLPLDPSRLYVVGMSSGATFAQRLALVRRDIAGVAAHSGPAPAGELAGENRFPILLLVGESDRLHASVRESAAAYAVHGHHTVHKTIPAHGHEWETSNNEAMWQFLSSCRLDPKEQ